MNFAVSVFKFFDILRRIILNLIFWGIVLAIGAVLIKNSIVSSVVPAESTLILSPTGFIVEHTPSNAADFISGSDTRKDTALREVIAVLNAAATDSNISSVFLDLRRFEGSSLSKLQEIAIAIKRVRDVGKPVIAFSDTYSQGRYYLASHAENIVVDPLGGMMFRGVGSFQNYYGQGLSKLGIKVDVFRAGEYKSAVEPYIYDRMSDAARRASAEYLEDLWDQYLAVIIEERHMTRADIDKYISNYAAILEKHKGDAAVAAKENNLVDIIAVYRDAIALAGSEKYIDWKDYYKIIKRKEKPAGDKVAVVIASGTIVPGRQPPGTIGASTYAAILEEIKNDTRVVAVVLRIDSGGGGVGASETIRRGLQDIRDEGKPVIVSMSSMAASGAYWISTASDSIFSMPATLTGSIGVFGMFPDISEFLEKYPGITTDGYGTTKFSGFLRPDMGLTEDMKMVLTMNIENYYNMFLNFISSSRNIPLTEIGNIADGRVWSGNAAMSRKLVDTIGTLEDAIDRAALQSGVADYSIHYYEPKENLRTVISRGLIGMAASGKKTIGERFYDLIFDTLPSSSERKSNLDMIFGNIFNESQALYLGPEYIFR